MLNCSKWNCLTWGANANCTAHRRWIRRNGRGNLSRNQAWFASVSRIRKEYFEVTSAQLHATVDSEATGKRSRMAYRDIIGDSFTLGEVVEMGERSADGKRIAFDIVILATATNYPKFSIAKPLGQGTIVLMLPPEPATEFLASIKPGILNAKRLTSSISSAGTT